MSSLAKLFAEKVPECRSQAEFHTMEVSFEALTELMRAIFRGKGVEDAQEKLDGAIDLVKQARELTNKLHEVPEAATSQAAEDCKRPPAEYEEDKLLAQYLAELETMDDPVAIRAWYTENRQGFDRIVTSGLRNQLFDTVRKKLRGPRD